MNIRNINHITLSVFVCETFNVMKVLTNFFFTLLLLVCNDFLYFTVMVRSLYVVYLYLNVLPQTKPSLSLERCLESSFVSKKKRLISATYKYINSWRGYACIFHPNRLQTAGSNFLNGWPLIIFSWLILEKTKLQKLKRGHY